MGIFILVPREGRTDLRGMMFDAAAFAMMG